MTRASPPVYQERPPAAPLRPWVECVWSLRGHVRPGSETPRSVLPDGCMDVIFDLAAGSDAREGARHFVVGTMTRPLSVTGRGSVSLVGVRFRPGAARAFLDLPAHELVDGRAPLDAFWGAAAGELWERMAGGDETALDDVLSARRGRGPAPVEMRPGRDDPLVRRASAALDAREPPSPSALARDLGVGRRQLERRFRQAVGVGPGALARILRFRRALAHIREGGRSLARVAAEAGYHDQPHMNRDFRDLAGATPGAFGAGAARPLDTDDARPPELVPRAPAVPAP